MAKVNGPLMSITASGSFGKTIVYATIRSIQYARIWKTPANPNSAAQQVIRGYFTDAVGAWHAETSSVRTTWDNYAKSIAYNGNGFNEYVGTYIKFLVNHSGTPPTITDTPPSMS
jgi:hypothetical protein